MPAQQLDLGREVTCADIVVQACAYLATKTHPHGNHGAARVCGSAEAMAALQRLQAASGTGDVAHTRQMGRAVVKEILNELKKDH